MLVRYLSEQGFEATAVGSARELDSAMAVRHFDLLILDVGMPAEDGFSVCQRLRARGERIPIIMLTARGDPIDRVVGLEAGADDYLGKPFFPRELVARVRAMLRRQTSSSFISETIEFGDFVIDLTRRQLLKGGALVHLSTAEFDLLEVLASHPHRPLTRGQLLDRSRGIQNSSVDRSVDVQILRLRRHIEDDPSHPAIIATVRGVGYVFKPPGEGR